MSILNEMLLSSILIVQLGKGSLPRRIVRSGAWGGSLPTLRHPQKSSGLRQRSQVGPQPRPPNVPPLRALSSRLDGLGGVLGGAGSMATVSECRPRLSRILQVLVKSWSLLPKDSKTHQLPTQTPGRIQKVDPPILDSSTPMV